jgi:chemotaxis signal transduction protein
VELLLFQVGARRYGVDARQVLGIGRAAGDTFALHSLGPLQTGRRALLFDSQGGKTCGLQVDSVEGVRQAMVADLRRMPEVACAHPYAMGIWLLGEEAVLLIDLMEGLKFQKSN